MNTNPFNPSDAGKPQGRCPFCGDANAYTNLACDGCGARLPWADALDADRRERIAAEHAAEAAREEAQKARQAATKARQAAPRSFPAVRSGAALPDDATGNETSPFRVAQEVHRLDQRRRENENADFWQGCAGGCFGVPVGCLGLMLMSVGWLFHVDDLYAWGFGLLILVVMFSRIGRRR